MSLSSFPPISEKKSISLWSWFHSSSESMPEVLVMDGGVSTHLEKIIAPKRFSHRNLWSSSLLLTEEGRASITEGHRDWLKSGCDILTTVTYQCHYGLFKGTKSAKTDLAVEQPDSVTEVMPEEKMKEMMIEGVLLARRAIDATNINPKREKSQSESIYSISSTLGPFVVASTGPYGAAMADGSEYTGNYPAHVTRQALVSFHTRKARTLLMEGEPDGLAVETIPNIEEVGVVCEVLRDLQQQREALQPNSSPIACWISLACRNGSEMNDGHTVEEALRTVQSCDPSGRWIAGVGINCFHSAYSSSLVNILKKSSLFQGCGRRGIIIYPNSGEGWDAVNEEWTAGSGTSDDDLVDQLIKAVKLIRDERKVESGTNDEAESNSMKHRSIPKIILGGCCRTNPTTISMLRKKVDEYNVMSDDI
mmetsp:Transcript_7037/g.17183  ORF Transcript_7037/g.17183 Transcript_7037/m.17183 type:complete len:421 (-) Transcript_7037:2486-3748(-)